MSSYATLDGHEVVPTDDARAWAAWFGDDRARGADRRRVAITKIGDVHVSTVFLGLNHDHFDTGRPLWFETMVFGVGPLDGEQERYTTWDEAEAGHAAMVARVMAAGDAS